MGLTIRAEAAPNMKEREVGGEPQLLSLSLIPSAGNEGHEAGIVNGAQKIFNVLTSWGPGEGIIVTGSTPVTAQVHRGPFKTPYRNLRDEPSRDIESLQLITLPNTTSYFDIDNPSWLTGTALHHTVVTSREANACIDNRRAAGFIDGQNYIYDTFNTAVFAGRAAIGALFDRATRWDPKIIGKDVRNSFRAMLNAGVAFDMNPRKKTWLEEIDRKIRVDQFIDGVFQGSKAGNIRAKLTDLSEIIRYDIGTAALRDLVMERLLEAPTEAAGVAYQGSESRSIAENRLASLARALQMPEGHAEEFNKNVVNGVKSSPDYAGTSFQRGTLVHHMSFGQ